ncbi:hypothetical protein [Nocardiopsis synnemataformans]|uniref:hypothetical protein n=1 Tax=Nocardiopsis synnemataformans TaxID=61305 RepID=UPI003EBE903C
MSRADRYPGLPRYLGPADLGRKLGVTTAAIGVWLDRYPPGSDSPAPAPDVAVGGTLGWREERLPEWEAWRKQRPGQGAGGGRPRRQPE